MSRRDPFGNLPDIEDIDELAAMIVKEGASKGDHAIIIPVSAITDWTPEIYTFLLERVRERALRRVPAPRRHLLRLIAAEERDGGIMRVLTLIEDGVTTASKQLEWMRKNGWGRMRTSFTEPG